MILRFSHEVGGGLRFGVNVLVDLDVGALSALRQRSTLLVIPQGAGGRGGRAAAGSAAGDAAELLECWEVLSHSYDDNTKHYEADTKFHEILANATHNVVIKKLFPIIQEGIRQFLSETSSLHTDETSRLHYEVMKAVITHDAAKARETMQLLICTNQDLLGW